MATKKTSKKKKKKKKKKKVARKTTKKSGEALRKEAIKEAEANLAAIEAEERGAKSKRSTKATKKTSSNKTTSKQRAAKPTKTKKRSGLDIAFEVLKAFSEPLNAKQIAERAIEAGWKTNGATPHATLYAAILREILAKGKDARFKKTDRGLFVASK